MKHHHIRAILLAVMLFAGLLLAHADPALKLKTVTIDAGHGGHDPGSISCDPTHIQEKKIVLDIALRLRDKINAQYPDVKVVMTRSSDKFVELKERADIANRNKSDLFISIHVNSLELPKGQIWHSVSGFSVHCLGKSSKGKDLSSNNMDIVRRENAVIKLEKDYSTSYEGFDPDDPGSYIIFNLMQNANQNQSLHFADLVNLHMGNGPLKNSRGISQDAFLVLWRTSMPAVLIECGFIVNKDDHSVLRTENGRDDIASRICAAFGDFKRDFEGGESVDNTSTPKVENAPEAESESLPTYGVQVLASPKIMNPKDPFFKGYNVISKEYGKLYRYIIVLSNGDIPSDDEWKKAKKEFPDSYRVIIENGELRRF